MKKNNNLLFLIVLSVAFLFGFHTVEVVSGSGYKKKALYFYNFLIKEY